jgi:hypothetical protein
MSHKYNIEFFQGVGSANNTGGGSDLSSAYSGGTVQDLISDPPPPEAGGSAAPAAANSIEVESSESSEPQGGLGIGNIWQFLGIENLSLKQKQCTYNCGVDLLGCLERCSNPDCRQQDGLKTQEQCRYGCIRKGVNCSTSCISNIEPEPDVLELNSLDMPNNVDITFTSSALQTTSAFSIPNVTTGTTLEEVCAKNYDLLPNEVKGVYANLDDFAPYDMRTWPKNNKFGWTISELNQMKRNGYNAPDLIEVNFNHSLFPIKSDVPSSLEFDFAKS